jgi:hypothetical protein
MWIYTRDGFFSAARDKYCGPTDIMVRARCRMDLVRMLRRLYGAQAKRSGLVLDIIELSYADYRYRYKLPHKDWVIYVGRMAAEIDYATVKDNICPDKSRARHEAMYGCWTEMCVMQDKLNG